MGRVEYQEYFAENLRPLTTSKTTPGMSIQVLSVFLVGSDSLEKMESDTMYPTGVAPLSSRSRAFRSSALLPCEGDAGFFRSLIRYPSTFFVKFFLLPLRSESEAARRCRFELAFCPSLILPCGADVDLFPSSRRYPGRRFGMFLLLRRCSESESDVSAFLVFLRRPVLLAFGSSSPLFRDFVIYEHHYFLHSCVVSLQGV